jgi:serine/threonine protein kinase
MVPPVREGDVLASKYLVERVLGVGGMGIVVAATHMELGQRVAIKFLHPGMLIDAVAVGRFAQEARAVVRLRSEHVARVLDVGRLDSGAPYIVMEYLEGVDLGSLLESKGPLPVTDAVDYVLQSCEAVVEAHSIGIVHRDLKPRNLFLTWRVDGKPLVKVLDFGISKSVLIPGSQATPQLSLTKTTDIMGSPMYMAPEQLRSSRRADERSDVWSFGVILFELLTAQVPFEAASVTELCAVLLQDPPRPVTSLRPDTPPALVQVIERCLQKDPAARFQSVADLATALEPLGSPDARGYAERARAIAAGTPPRSVPSSAVPSSRVAVTGGTSVSWGETQLAPSGRVMRRTGIWAFVAIAGLAVLGISTAAVVVAVRSPAAAIGAAADPKAAALAPPPATGGASTTEAPTTARVETVNDVADAGTFHGAHGPAVPATHATAHPPPPSSGAGAGAGAGAAGTAAGAGAPQVPATAATAPHSKPGQELPNVRE